MRSNRRARREPTGKEAIVVDYCIEALGPYYAGTKTSGTGTTLLGYYGKVPVPALRVTSEPSPEGDDNDHVPPAIDLQVLLPDIVNVDLLEHRLEELAEEAEREAWKG